MKKIITLFIITLLLFTSVTTASAESVYKSRTDFFLKNTPVSKTAYKACIKYGKEYDIDPFLIMAVIETESGGSPRVSNGGCYGLMGVSKYWNRNRMKKLSVTNLYDETQNVKVGANLLAEYVKKYGEGRGLVCYNCGEGGARKVKHLSRYARRILSRRDTLKKAYKASKKEYKAFKLELKRKQVIGSVKKKAVNNLFIVQSEIIKR